MSERDRRGVAGAHLWDVRRHPGCPSWDLDVTTDAAKLVPVRYGLLVLLRLTRRPSRCSLALLLRLLVPRDGQPQCGELFVVRLYPAELNG